jgi:lipopolysaccharide/colanic/teichoic acid biosynthesis glycosyltransferase
MRPVPSPGGRRGNVVAVELPKVSAPSRRIMRVFDLVGAAGLLAVFSPVILAAAVLVKVTTPGPVIFRQKRVGQSGALFEVLKLRTMVDGTHERVLADPELRQQYEANDFKLPEDDPRITKVGRFLRKTSLDELPQLVNVLRNEMSLVGVRPLLPAELARRPSNDQRLYAQHLPGMTGLWQVEGRATVTDDERLSLDRRYLADWSVRQNLLILLRTPHAVLLGSGAH